MIPKEFDYVAPGTLDEALNALREGGEDAKVLAGGHSLIPMMKVRLAAPTLLVDLGRISDLKQVWTNNGGLEIGSMVTYYQLHTNEDIANGCSLLAETALAIGDNQVRARGTIGGSIAHADPAADATAAVLALGATIVTNNREIPASDFFLDLFTTALEPGEIVTAIRVPRHADRTGTAYVKVRNKASHYALVGAAAVVSLGEDGSCSDIVVALTGAAAKPFRLEGVENALKGTRLEDNDLDGAIGTVGATDVDWMSDLFGSGDYRKHLAGVVARRAIEAAKGRV
ncbi:MAG: xanthine dehydrogenase family protein subunit M [Chloroflexia bacterium]